MLQQITVVGLCLAFFCLLSLSSNLSANETSKTSEQNPNKDTAPSEPADNQADKILKSFPLKTLSFTETEKLIEPFISDTGEYFYLESRDTLIVYDQPQAVTRISRLLKEIDTVPVNIRISVSFDETARKNGGNVDAVSDGLKITRRRGGEIITEGAVSIRGGASSSRRDEFTSQFIVTTDDRPARILVGRSVAQPVWIYRYGLRRGWWERGVKYEDLGASLWVHPKKIGNNMVQVEVYPKLTFPGKDERSVEVRELSTKVTVRDGQSIQIGGLDKSQQEFYRRLFGIGQVFSGQSLNISLQAEIMHRP